MTFSIRHRRLGSSVGDRDGTVGVEEELPEQYSTSPMAPKW